MFISKNRTKIFVHITKIRKFDLSKVVSRQRILPVFLGAGLICGALVQNVNIQEAFAYTTSLYVSGTVVVDVSVGANGANITTDSVEVTSTCPTGYDLSIVGPSDATLYKDGDPVNSDDDSRKIEASSGTLSAPVPIFGDNNGGVSYYNTWGYTTKALNGGNPATVHSNFVGLNNTPAMIATKATASGDESSDQDIVEVYYGASVDETITPGIYTMAESAMGDYDNVITYTLTTNLDCMSYLVEFSPTSIVDGVTVSGTGTMLAQRIHEGVATNLNVNTLVAPSSYYFAGWNTEQDGTGTFYEDAAQVTDLATSGATITLYAQWVDCPPNNICYNDNGAQSVTTMSNQSIRDDDTSVGLYASNFKRTDYGFAGWSTKPTTTGDGRIMIPDGTETYGPNEILSFETGKYSTAGLKLYAMWVEYNNADSMQDWADMGLCSSLSVGEATALMDARDDEVYAVARLADGNCWMIENLRLDIDGSSNSAWSQGFGGVFNGLAESESMSSFVDSTIANSLYYSGMQSGTATIDIGTGDSPGYRMPRFNNENSGATVSNMTSPSQAVYSYGNYYSWSAAIGNTDTVADNNSSVSTSICPSGWWLPRGGNKANEVNNDFWNLVVTNLNEGVLPSNYDSATRPYYTSSETQNIRTLVRKYPNNFVYSGYTDRGYQENRGVSGEYWTSTSGGATMAYSFSLHPNYYPGTANMFRYNGMTVRCMTQ